ncbi:MAG: hypothetical protein ACK50I_01780 [Burkholderiales bacterium]
MAAPAPASRFSFGRFLLYVLLIVLAVGALYFAVVLNWSYSSGERAGWVQKFSKKGWLCKTWEGEVALVSMQGAIPEKFEFTVTDDTVAEQINRHMGHRVSLHYELKVGLPTTCLGETGCYVTRVVRVEDGTGGPGSAMPGTPGAPGTPGVLPAPSAPPPPPPPVQAPAPPASPAPSGDSAPSGPTPGQPTTGAPAAPSAPAATPAPRASPGGDPATRKP